MWFVYNMWGVEMVDKFGEVDRCLLQRTLKAKVVLVLSWVSFNEVRQQHNQRCSSESWSWWPCS